MKARDVMVSPVLTVKPSSSVKEIAQTLMKHHISAVPVVDAQGKLVGMVSEGDLMRRAELGTEQHRSWWLFALTSTDTLADEYSKAHGRTAADVMTRHVVTAGPETPLHEIATLLEKHGVKRVPIVENNQLVGVVSRANLIQALATSPLPLEIALSDNEIRDAIMKRLRDQPWTHAMTMNVTVKNGIVELWGYATSGAEKKAIRVAAESVSGVCGVNNNVVVQPVLWAA